VEGRLRCASILVRTVGAGSGDRTERFASIGLPEKGGGPNLIHMLEGTLEVQAARRRTVSSARWNQPGTGERREAGFVPPVRGSRVRLRAPGQGPPTGGPGRFWVGARSGLRRPLRPRHGRAGCARTRRSSPRSARRQPRRVSAFSLEYSVCGRAGARQSGRWVEAAHHAHEQVGIARFGTLRAHRAEALAQDGAISDNPDERATAMKRSPPARARSSRASAGLRRRGRRRS
jgi:hypothetical protein